MGAVWLIDQYRVGIVAKDLFAKDIQTQNRNNTYKLDTQIVVSGSYVSDFFIAAVDLALTKQRRFNGDNDDTQFMRFGVEGNAWGWRSSEPVMKWTYKTRWITRFLSVLASARGMLLA